MAKKKKMSFEERQKMFQERKEKLIKRDNTRVVFARTRDTQALLALVQAGDLAIKRIRDGMGINYDIAEASEKLTVYNSAIRAYAEIVDDLCKYTGVDFKVPKWMRDDDENGEESEVENKEQEQKEQEEVEVKQE